MKLVLIQDVQHLGRKHDIVDVKPGFGRNYLLPQGLATFATPGVLAQAEKTAERRTKQRQQMQAQAKELAQKIKNVVLTFSRRVTGKGALYGSVSNSEIAKALAKEIDCPIDSEAIQVGSPIKKLGEHRVTLQLTEDVSAILHLKVVKQA